MTAPPYAAASCYRHPQRSAGVRCVRCDRPICPDCMVPASVGFQCPECVRDANRTLRQPVTRFGGRTVAGSPVTLSLIAINVAVFVVTSATGGLGGLLSGRTGANGSIYDKFALIPPAVAHGEWWRLISSAFLHYGLLHIVFNMTALLFIGPAVEAALGRWRYVSLYALSGIGGSLLTVALAAPASQSAGASGAIFGLFGALYVLQRRVGQRAGGILPVIVINLVLSFTIPDISWEGHIGGLIAGTAITVALVTSAGSAAGRVRRHVAVLVAAAVVMAGLGIAAVHRENDVCATTTNRDDFVYCQVYDPPGVGSGGRSAVGNAAGAHHVVLSGTFARNSGGRHA